jgi:hypothetical protein
MGAADSPKTTPHPALKLTGPDFETGCRTGFKLYLLIDNIQDLIILDSNGLRPFPA